VIIAIIAIVGIPFKSFRLLLEHPIVLRNVVLGIVNVGMIDRHFIHTHEHLNK
jgi:hypothetical protein